MHRVADLLSPSKRRQLKSLSTAHRGQQGRRPGAWGRGGPASRAWIWLWELSWPILVLCSATQFGTTDADRGPASAYCTSCDSITAAPLIAFCASTSVVAKSLW